MILIKVHPSPCQSKSLRGMGWWAVGSEARRDEGATVGMTGSTLSFSPMQAAAAGNWLHKSQGGPGSLLCPWHFLAFCLLLSHPGSGVSHLPRQRVCSILAPPPVGHRALPGVVSTAAAARVVFLIPLRSHHCSLASCVLHPNLHGLCVRNTSGWWQGNQFSQVPGIFVDCL